MPDDVAFTSPPVREVELTVFFSLIPELAASHLSGIREQWRHQYPNVDEEYPLRAWRPSEDTADTAAGPRGRFPCPLVTFSNHAGDAVAIQSDRILRRWTIGPEGYPGFEVLREDLGTRLDDFTAALEADLDTTPVLTGASCRYVNQVSGVGPSQLALGLMTGWTVEHATLVGSYVGLHVHQSDDDELDDCSLMITVDGARDGDSLLRLEVETDSLTNSPECLGGLQRAHDVLVRKFLQLTTSDQHRKWGRL